LGNGSKVSAATPTAQNYNKSGNYQVTLRAYSARGCESVLTKNVSVLNLVQIPNVITPNDDGKNDTFTIAVPNSQIEIYNRWGKRLFVSDNYADDWGKDISNGTYYYLLTLPNGVQCKGWIQVLE